MSASQPLQLHSRVRCGNLGHGEVLFVGQTSFATGVWVGVELDSQNGKNNGSVQSKRYFDCEDGYGVFVRPSQVHVLSPEEEMHSIDDEPIPQAIPTARATRPATTATAAASRLSPTKTVAATPARTPASRTSLAPNAPPSTVRRTSATSVGSSVSSASASRPPTSASITSRTASPVKSATGLRSPVKPTATGRLSVASGAARSAAASSLSSRTGSPSTPAAPTRTVRATAATAATPGATRTPAATVGVSRTVTRPTPSSATSSAASAKPQTPSAARAGLRPVPTSRPSMVAGGARIAASSPSVTSASRVAAARSAAASAPISRAGSSASAASRAGSSLGPSRLGPRSSSGSAVSSGRTSASQRLLDHDDEDEEAYQDEELKAGHASEIVGEDTVDNDDIGDEGDQTISADTVADSAIRSTKPLNKSTRDFMSLVEPSSSASNVRSSAEFGALQKEVEELRAKVRVLEKKRDDERARISELEKQREEAEQSIAAAPKLTAKVQELQAELNDQKKLEKDWAMQKDDFERQLSRVNDELESLTLDREMAEEKAETAALEAQEHLMSLEAANAKIRALEKDLNPHLLRRRAAPGAEGDDQDAGSEGAADGGEEHGTHYSPASDLLQRENDQLRRVLRDLRDRSNETEGEHRRKIIELERENAELIELNSTNDSLLPELENAESMIEDLKLQLDDALGAQDLVEQLTERNLQLSDLVKKLRDEIEEHETIAEINNELEEQHTINEKELREEVDLCESRIRDLQARNEGLENNAVDYQNTFAQFRDLVSNLQSELEAAKAEQAEYGGGAGAGRKDLADQAMLNLNLKLQSSALKSQAKTIDLELGRLQASQATSHLEMVRSYLPSAYFEADADAVNCLLFFRRMAVKSDLIKSIVESNHDIQESLSGIVPEIMVSVCQMRHSIAHFSALSRQIAAVLRLAPTEVFLRGGRMYRENMAIERKVDSFIAALRREELKEQECGHEFGRFVKQFEDFTMALGGDENDSDLAAKEVGSANLIDHDLDTLIAALGYAKQQLAQLYADDDVDWEMGSKNIEDDLFDPLQELINRIRNTKVITRKVLRRLLSLAENDEAVRMEAIMNLPPLGRLTSQLVTFATQLSTSISSYVAEVRSSKTAFDISKITAMVEQATSDGLGKTDITLWSTPLSSTSHLSTTIQTVLTAIVEQENVIRIDGPGPWLARSEDIKTQATQNPELDRQVAKLSEDARDLLRQVKARDQALQESSIRIERLQKQLEKSKAQVDEHSDVRATLGETQKQAKAYQEANDALQSEIEALQKDHDRLKAQIAAAPAAGVGTGDADGAARTLPEGAAEAGASYSSLETSYLVDQLEALKGALKHLRHENAVLKGSALLQQMEALPVLARSHRTAMAPKEGGEESDTKKLGEPVQRATPRPVRKNAASGSIRAEARQMYKTALTTLALSSVVDLTPLRKPGGDTRAKGTGRPWLPYDKQPEVQLEQQRQTKVRLARQLSALSERLAPASGTAGTVTLRAVKV